MGVINQIYCIIIGTIESILLCQVLFGMEKKSKKTRYFLLPFTAILGCFLVQKGVLADIWFTLLWIIIIIFSFFKVSLFSLLRNSILIFFMIVIMESLLWSVGLIFVSNYAIIEKDWYVLGTGLIGLPIWLIICSVIRKKRIRCDKFFSKLTKTETVFCFLGLFAMNILFACMQGFLLEQMNQTLKKVAVIFCIVVILFMLIVVFYLMSTTQKKKYLEYLAETNQRYMAAQMKYYEKSVKKYEELRSFRHDVKNHFLVMSMLSEEKKYDELEQYMEKFRYDKILDSFIYTGNTIVDALFIDIFGKCLDEKEMQYSFLGRMPEVMEMEDADLCILFSNAFQNAFDSLEKQKGEKKFRMEVRQGEQELAVIMKNTVEQKTIDIEVSSKRDKENHGYGVKNMKNVVDKYDGEIKWFIRDDMMNVEIYLPVSL